MTDDEAQAKITENVLKLMGVRGYYTQQALGDAIGKKPPEMSRRVSGQTRWTLADVLALAKALAIQPGDLFADLKVSITSLPATGTDGVKVARNANDTPSTSAVTGTDMVPYPQHNGVVLPLVRKRGVTAGQRRRLVG